MKVALVQVASPPEEPVAARRDRVGELVHSAGDAELVILPELWAPGYFSFDEYETRAETLDGDTVSQCADWARSLGIHLHLGSIVERAADGAMYNTAILLDPTGEIRHAYRKIHIFGYQSREAQLVSPGEDVSVTQTDFGPLAATTCYDLRFPELWRAIVDRGAETVLVPAAWPMARVEHWRLFTTCRAVEEQILLIACNAVGVQAGGVELGGHSRIVDPWGRVLVEAGTDEGVTYCDVDPAVVAEVRQEFPVLGDRRFVHTLSGATR